MAYYTDEVFNKLRVSDSNQPTYHTVYNGISANTWLTPIGVAQKRNVPKMQKNTAWPLAEELKVTLCERARSANAVLGRRHFELERQQIGTDEVLEGTRVLPATRNRPRTATTFQLLKQYNPWTVSQRPHTSACDKPLSVRINRISSLPAASNEDTVDELPNVSVTQLLSNNRANCRKTSDSRRCVSATDVRQNKTILNDYTLSFRTLAAMNEAYSSRLTPAVSVASNYDTLATTRGYEYPLSRRTSGNSNSNASALEQERLKTPSTRYDQTTAVKPRETRSGSSGLKPLLYSEDCAIQHSAGCPYMCKGCFRACLASDNYVDEAEKEATAAVKYRKHHKPRVHFADQRNRRHLIVVEKDLPLPRDCVDAV